MHSEPSTPTDIQVPLPTAPPFVPLGFSPNPLRTYLDAATQELSQCEADLQAAYKGLATARAAADLAHEIGAQNMHLHVEHIELHRHKVIICGTNVGEASRKLTAARAALKPHLLLHFRTTPNYEQPVWVREAMLDAPEVDLGKLSTDAVIILHRQASVDLVAVRSELWAALRELDVADVAYRVRGLGEDRSKLREKEARVEGLVGRVMEVYRKVEMARKVLLELGVDVKVGGDPLDGFVFRKAESQSFRTRMAERQAAVEGLFRS